MLVLIFFILLGEGCLHSLIRKSDNSVSGEKEASAHLLLVPVILRALMGTSWAAAIAASPLQPCTARAAVAELQKGRLCGFRKYTLELLFPGQQNNCSQLALHHLS